MDIGGIRPRVIAVKRSGATAKSPLIGRRDLNRLIAAQLRLIELRRDRGLPAGSGEENLSRLRRRIEESEGTS